jgi:hypothetical protein
MRNAVPILAALMFMMGAAAPRAMADVAPAGDLTIHTFAPLGRFSEGDNAGCEASFEKEHPLCDSYQVTVTDSGSVTSQGPIVVKDLLPTGLVVKKVRFELLTPEETVVEESGDCEPAVPVKCTFPTSLSPNQKLKMLVFVTVEPGTKGTNTATVTGASSPDASASEPVSLGSAPISFGPSSLTSYIARLDGAPDTQAGSHPYEFTARIDLNSVVREAPNGIVQATSVNDVRDVVIDFPLGLVDNEQATPQCPLWQLASLSGCPIDTRVGQILTESERQTEANGPIYNLVPEKGVAAEFGFSDALKTSHVIYASVVPTPAGYVLRATIREAPQIPLTDMIATFYGDPQERNGGGGTPVAMFTNPSDCSGEPRVATVHLDSWQEPGAFADNGTPAGEPEVNGANWVSTSSAAEESPPVSGCSALHFDPEAVAFAPERANSQADEPAGYELYVRLPQAEVPGTLGTPPLKTAIMTLPPGVAISPSVADGLVGCKETGGEGINFAGVGSGHCPEASKVGMVEVDTPLVERALTGGIYFVQPKCGGPRQPACTEEAAETGEIFGVYLEVGSEDSGIHIKLKGKIEVGGAGTYSHQHGLQPGQVRTTFAELPRLAFSELKLKFNAGPRALLANPQTCGSFATEGELEPWSHGPAPGEAQGTPNATSRPSFTITGCESRFTPSFTAGTITPVAGAYSPFTLTLSRQDREQDLSAFTFTTPAGLLANLSSVPACPEPQAGQGRCSQASELGTATVAAGAGSHPVYLSGHVYLTGPTRLEGPNQSVEPYGLSILVPAEIGPFQLGAVTIRASVAVDPATAALTIATGELPQIIDGIPLRIRTVNVTLDRHGFILNPTNCSQLDVTGTVSSVQGVGAKVASPFTATGCKRLPFKPKLTALTYGNGEFGGHGASLHVKLTTGTGEANMRSLKLDLPQRLPARLETIQKACRKAMFDVNPAACPKASVIGSASVQTPILAGTMAGPAYLVAKSGSRTSHPGESKTEKEEAAFPDLVLVLQSQGVRIDLTGGLFVSAKNITSVAFRSIPDVPIRRLDLVLPEGKSSILAASAGLCTKRPLTMLTAVTGQNGARVKPTVKVAVAGCKHKKKRHSKKKRHRARRRSAKKR